MKNSLFTAFILLSFVLTACGPGGPEESEVKSKVVGEYCGEARHKLILAEDGSYTNQRTVKSPFTGSPMIEKCMGKWSLVQNGSDWNLKFDASTEGSSIMVTCAGKEVLVWKEEGGYVGGDSILEISELMDGIIVKKGQCF